MTQPTPAVDSVWRSRCTTGLRVIVTATDSYSGVRIAELDPTGQPQDRSRWTTVQMLQNAYEEE
ncbi:hypothetical protein GCM10010275_71900 [Streptomyces litmocidini]|uniref:hypothetical protein n=1 Tax=Streptomyces litmocidini TaxID=67318 RepID=UPI00167D89BB|nr:hypothetical protein [Streptomyces litmocidini]GGV19848.1 hypothetical protein GCM10010275_71900 [Streptomyces litmocidini]